MSHQSGIRASEDLRLFFGQRNESDLRLLKIVIQKEKMVLEKQWPVKGSLKQDFERSIPACLTENEPCFLMVRLDSVSSSGYDWLLITYAPDCAAVKMKMIYAASRSTLKSDLGDQNIRQEMHVSSLQEATFEAYERFLINRDAPAPLTEVEQQMRYVKSGEQSAQMQQASILASQTANGVAFPIDQNVVGKLEQLRDGVINYVQMSVDILNEAIKLERFDTVSVNQLKSLIPRDKPRYHFYAYKHTFSGKMCNSIVFLYSMPGQGCSIKEKMLYSSCKLPFLNTCQTFIKIVPDRKIELDNGEDINEAYLIEELHPPAPTEAKKFDKPRGPPGRGNKRLTKAK